MTRVPQQQPPPVGELAARVTLLALTVREPWATAIATADPRELGPLVGKGIENRSWPPWPRIVGTYVAIHAGKHGIDAEDVISVGRLLYGHDWSAETRRTWVARLASDAGKIVCVAKVVGVAPVRPEQQRWQIPGLIGWVLEDVRALARPMIARGAQGLWPVAAEDAREISAQVGLR